MGNLNLISNLMLNLVGNSAFGLNLNINSAKNALNLKENL